MKILSDPSVKSIVLMMNFMHLVEVRCVKETMPPIKEEIFNEVDNKHLNKNLAKFWEIIKANSNAVYVCNEYGYRVDYKLIHEQIFDQFALCFTPIFPIPRSCRLFID